MDDAKQMIEVSKALKTLGLSDKEQNEIMAIVASVLHLGNIGVVEEKGQAVLNNTNHLKYAAEVRLTSIMARKLIICLVHNKLFKFTYFY